MVKHLAASGYIAGDADNTANITIHQVWVFPKAAAGGTWKINKGVNGAGDNILPITAEGTIPAGRQVSYDNQYPYNMKFAAPVRCEGSQCYATLSNCEISVEYTN